MAPKKAPEEPPPADVDASTTDAGPVPAWEASPEAETLLLSRAAAVVSAADAEAPQPTDVLEAATTLLQQDQELKAAAAGQSAPDDFKAVCKQLQLVPHPGVLKALAGEEGSWTKEAPGTVSVRGWQCDLPTLTALLLVLSKHPSLRALKFWRCGLGAPQAKLLQLHEALAALSIEGDEEGQEEGGGAAAAVEAAKCASLATLSLRCAPLPSSAVGALAEQLKVHAGLTALSLFSTRLGDEGAALLLTALKDNEKLAALNLGSNLLTDTTAQAVLDAVADPPPPDEATGEEAPPPPRVNRTLTALNLSRNRIGTAGRALLEAAQAASPALVRLELRGNPCLSCGPGASLTPAQRQLISSSWEKLGEAEGGASAFCASLLKAAWAAVPAAKALAGEKEPPPPAEGEEAAEAEAEAEEAPSAEAVAAAATLEAALGSLVGKLGAPEELRQSLAEWGLKAASRGLGCGEPFDKLGEALVTALQEALGADEATDGAWRELYAQASVVMQAQYTPGQVAEAKAEVEARAKAAAEAEAAAAEAAAAQE